MTRPARESRPAPTTVRGGSSPGSAAFRRALALTATSTLVAMLAYAGPLGNAPTLAASLSPSTSARTWILSSMSVGLAVSVLSFGALADDFGRRRVFAAGGLAFAAGSAVCAVAGGPVLFVLGRTVEGVGAAGLMATGLGLVSVVTHTRAQRAATASWWAASLGAGIALGPLVTGLLDQAGAWRLFYWLTVGAGLAFAGGARMAYRETAASADRRIDAAGLVTMTAGLGLLLTSLIEARQGRQQLTLETGAAAALMLAAFVVTQLRSRAPMLDLRLLRRPDFAAATLAALATGGGVIALMSFACTFLVTAMRLSTFEAAAVLAVWSATSAVAALAARRMAPGLSGNPQLVIGLGGVGLGMLQLASLDPRSGPGQLVPGLLLAGVASGILNAGLGRQSVASAPPERAAMGTGTNNTARYLGASIGVAIVSIVAAAPAGSRADLVAGWNIAATITGVISMAGAAAVAALGRTRVRM